MPLREIFDGDSYTEDELERGEVVLVMVARFDEPDVNTQGESWGWTKGPPFPRGYRADGRYGPDDGGPTEDDGRDWHSR